MKKTYLKPNAKCFTIKLDKTFLAGSDFDTTKTPEAELGEEFGARGGIVFDVWDEDDAEW